jgi:hypothetical protein
LAIFQGDITMRIVLAGLVGGIAMFVWTSIAHVALPLGQIGFRAIPGEAPVLAAMHQSMGDRAGLYFFPWTDMKGKDAMAMEAARMKANPSGLLIYRPPGALGMDVTTLIVEFVKEVLVSLIAAFLLARTVIFGYAARAGFIALVGIAATLTTNVSYWNWYAFPADYTLAAMTIEAVGYLAAALAIAAILRPWSAYRLTREPAIA